MYERFDLVIQLMSYIHQENLTIISLLTGHKIDSKIMKEIDDGFKNIVFEKIKDKKE